MLDRILVHIFEDLTTLKNFYHLRYFPHFYFFFIEYHELMKSFSLIFKIGGGGIKSESGKNIQITFQKQVGFIVCPLSPSNYVET